MNNNRKAKAKYIHDAGKRNLGRKKLEAMFIKKDENRERSKGL